MAKSAKKAAHSHKKEPKAAHDDAAATGSATGDEEDDAPLPLASRVVIIVATSYLAEKIWRYRSVVSAGWYSERQSPWEQAMVTGFEYTLAMGALFFLGIFVSVATITVQKRVFGV